MGEQSRDPALRCDGTLVRLRHDAAGSSRESRLRCAGVFAAVCARRRADVRAGCSVRGSLRCDPPAAWSRGRRSVVLRGQFPDRRPGHVFGNAGQVVSIRRVRYVAADRNDERSRACRLPLGKGKRHQHRLERVVGEQTFYVAGHELERGSDRRAGLLVRDRARHRVAREPCLQQTCTGRSTDAADTPLAHRPLYPGRAGTTFASRRVDRVSGTGRFMVAGRRNGAGHCRRVRSTERAAKCGTADGPAVTARRLRNARHARPGCGRGRIHRERPARGGPDRRCAYHCGWTAGHAPARRRARASARARHRSLRRSGARDVRRTLVGHAARLRSALRRRLVSRHAQPHARSRPARRRAESAGYADDRGLHNARSRGRFCTSTVAPHVREAARRDLDGQRICMYNVSAFCLRHTQRRRG